MSRPLDLAKRLREVLIDGQWIANTNFKDQIFNVRWEHAIHSIYSLNSIALLTFHVTYYLKGLNHVFEGGPLDISDKYSFDMSPINSSDDWNILIKDFLDSSELIVYHVENMQDEILDQPFVDEKYGTYTRNIEAVIEHSYYHLGQVTLLKKIIGC